MSSLTSLFNRGLLGAKCKTCLNLAISRIKLLRNKREVQLKQMKKEIAQYIQTGQEAIARIRVEHIIREENVSAAYEILELFCEFVLARVPILENQRDCPVELQEAIASIIYAAPRCSDLPELMQVRSLFSTKYGKEFVAAASDLRPDSNVNRMVIEKLSVKAPPAEVKLRSLRGITKEFGIEWDASSTEIEFSKTHEDLLAGVNSSVVITENLSHVRREEISNSSEVVNNNKTAALPAQSQSHYATATSDDLKVNPRPLTFDSSDVLERARAAIAFAQQASASARSAAELVTSGAYRSKGI